MCFAGSGSNNSILVSGCKNLENLTVTLQVTQDLITVGNKGFSLQLNSYPQPTAITPNSTPGTTFPGKVVGQLDWFQYLIIVANNRVSFEIQYWASAKSYQTGGPGGNPPEIRWPPDYTPNPADTSAWLPVFPHSATSGTVVGSMSSNKVPAGSQLKIQLATDASQARPLRSAQAPVRMQFGWRTAASTYSEWTYRRLPFKELMPKQRGGLCARRNALA
jgi:hypothetical protein